MNFIKFYNIEGVDSYVVAKEHKKRCSRHREFPNQEWIMTEVAAILEERARQAAADPLNEVDAEAPSDDAPDQ